MSKHTCCSLDLKKLSADIKAIATAISDIKDKHRETKLMAVDDEARWTSFYKLACDRLPLRNKVTLLCALRSRHRGRKHFKKMPYVPCGWGPSYGLDEQKLNAKLDEIAAQYQQEEKVAA